jgi:hypothetical protein
LPSVVAQEDGRGDHLEIARAPLSPCIDRRSAAAGRRECSFQACCLDSARR